MFRLANSDMQLLALLALALGSPASGFIHTNSAFLSSTPALSLSMSSHINRGRPLSLLAPSARGSVPQHNFRTKLAFPSSLKLASSSSPPENRRFPTPTWQVTVLCVLGVALTLYALRVEALAKASQDFKAACDLGSWASCTRVSRSVFGTGLGIIDPRGPLGFLAWSNALYGLLYYLWVLILQLPALFPLFKSRALALLAASGSLAASLYLALVLAFALKDMCIVCVSCYVVNAALFYFVLRDYNRVTRAIRAAR